MKSILLTGFEPFLSYKVNPSEFLVSNIKNINGYKVASRVLPVSYQRAPKEMFNLLNNSHWDGVISLGLAAQRDKISLERVALNWQEGGVADNDGLRPQIGKFYPEKEAALFNPLDLERAKFKLQKEEISTEISWSAGAYVCNRIYFDLLEYGLSSKIPVLFVHIPPWTCISQEKQSLAIQHLITELF